MRDHYWRMRAYSPYFDSRTTWYPGAWAYRDAYAIYRGSSLANEHPDWVLKDPSGNRLYIPYACDGSSCTQYAADIGNPEWRRYYIDAAKANIAQGYRGIFVDDVNLAFNVGNGAGQLVAPIDPRTGVRMTHDAWQRYFAEFMEQLRAELPASAEIVQNQVYFHVGLSSPYVKRAIEAATHIEIERGVNDTGIRGGTGTFGFETVLAWIDYAHSRGKGVIYDVQTDWGREYAIATYLVNSTGRDGLGMDVGALPDAWWSGWDTDLGAPLNDRYTWNGLFRRDFERGSVFVNQPDRPAVTVAPGGSWKRLDGSTVTSVSLPSRDGLVLLRDGVAAPPPPPPPPPAASACRTPPPPPRHPRPRLPRWSPARPLSRQGCWRTWPRVGRHRPPASRYRSSPRAGLSTARPRRALVRPGATGSGGRSTSVRPPASARSRSSGRPRTPRPTRSSPRSTGRAGPNGPRSHWAARSRRSPASSPLRRATCGFWA